MTEGPWAAAQGALLDHRHHGGGTSREDGLWPLDPGADCFGKGNILQTRLLTPPLPCVLDIHHTECKIGHLPHQTVWWVSYFTHGVVDVLCGGCHTIPPIILHICNFLYATDFFGLEKVRKKMVSIQDKHFFATKQLKLIFIQIHIGILVGVHGVLFGILGVFLAVLGVLVCALHLLFGPKTWFTAFLSRLSQKSQQVLEYKMLTTFAGKLQVVQPWPIQLLEYQIWVEGALIW